jgi:hypothetical protein
MTQLNFVMFKKWKPDMSTEYFNYYAFTKDNVGFVIRRRTHSWNPSIPYEMSDVSGIAESLSKYDDCSKEEFLEVLQQATSTMMTFANRILMDAYK